MPVKNFQKILTGAFLFFYVECVDPPCCSPSAAWWGVKGAWKENVLRDGRVNKKTAEEDIGVSCFKIHQGDTACDAHP